MPILTKSSINKRKLRILKANKHTNTSDVNIELHENPVVDYLKQRSNDILSLKTISKALKLKRSKVLYYIKHTCNVDNPSPFLVGSGKDTLHIYQYKINNVGVNIKITDL